MISPVPFAMYIGGSAASTHVIGEASTHVAGQDPSPLYGHPTYLMVASWIRGLSFEPLNFHSSCIPDHETTASGLASPVYLLPSTDASDAPPLAPMAATASGSPP